VIEKERKTRGFERKRRSDKKRGRERGGERGRRGKGLVGEGERSREGKSK